MLRAASSRPVPSAAAIVPPSPMIDIAANCEAPVNTRSDIAQALPTDIPVVVASTPKTTPTSPVAMPIAMPSRTGRTRWAVRRLRWHGRRACQNRPMDHETIAVDVTDQIMTITLDRPDRLNAFTVTMLRELLDAFDRADADDDVRVVIVTGAGRAFCAGADLGRRRRGLRLRSRIRPGRGARVGDRAPDGGGLLTLRIFRCTKPVIAAINGPAVGVGATMTLPMDIRFASDTPSSGSCSRRRGIVPEACSSWFLPRVVGISTAAEWCYTGRVFPAAEALDAGLVRSVHPADELLPGGPGPGAPRSPPTRRRCRSR